MDLIKVRKAHLLKLIEKLRAEDNWDAYELADLLEYPTAEKDGVITINPELAKDIFLREAADAFCYYKIPYVHFDCGEGEYDDYWEYYNPTVSEEPKTANYSNEHNDYIFKKWNLKELEHLPAEEFKQAVINHFENPFSEYPSLEELED